jgi:predicted AAA+ superfamily ATPase
MPQLHVAATGSLLEFAIAAIPSFGVGRISSLFMYPLTFEEFLRAIGMGPLANRISESNVQNPVDAVLHKKAIEHLRTYCAIGGMPAVVDCYRSSRDIRSCQLLIDDIIYLKTIRVSFASTTLH